MEASFETFVLFCFSDTDCTDGLTKFRKEDKTRVTAAKRHTTSNSASKCLAHCKSLVGRPIYLDHAVLFVGNGKAYGFSEILEFISSKIRLYVRITNWAKISVALKVRP